MRWKVLNLYAGIGGNRKLWEDVDVVAVEWERDIAKIYMDNFPNDDVVVRDAHGFLLDNFEEFDFIWSSPPCPTHSIMRKNVSVPRGQSLPTYPDMKLYEEILFLKHYFKGKWVVENVKSYYAPLIRPQEMQRHYFWGNFPITPIKLNSDNIAAGKIGDWEKRFGFNLSKHKMSIEKKTVLRNCVHPMLGAHVLNCAREHKMGLRKWI